MSARLATLTDAEAVTFTGYKIAATTMGATFRARKPWPRFRVPSHAPARGYPFERNGSRAAILYRPTCDVRALHPCDALPAGTARVLSWLAARPFRPSHSRCRMRHGRADARGA